MSKKIRVLMVDDEPNVLSGYRRSIGRKHDLVTAEGGLVAMKTLAKEPPFAVIVTDMRMPEMDGLAFLKAAKARYKDCVYMMLTGNADQQTAINAINEGQIFRFLNKPCPAETLEAAIVAANRQHELIQAERTLLKETLSGSVKLMVEAMAVSDPQMTEVITRVRDDSQKLRNTLGMDSDWQLPIAASLSLLGSIAVPDSLGKSDLTNDYLNACAVAGAKLLRHIPRLEGVSQIIANQYQGGDMPETLDTSASTTRIEIESRILGFVMEWHRQTRHTNGDRADALKQLSTKEECTHDQRLVTAAKKLVEQESIEQASQDQDKPITIEFRSLRVYMTVDENIATADGTLLVAKGQQLTPTMIERLRGFASTGVITTKTVRVYPPPRVGADMPAAA